MRIACLGDSLTEGSVSYNWVAALATRLGDKATIRNFGVNGELAYNALQRIESVVEFQADLVIILLGTNDVIAATSENNTKSYILEKQLPQRPDQVWYIANMQQICTTLLAKSKVLLVTIPPLGDDLSNPANDLVRAYNANLLELAQQLELAVLDLYTAMATSLKVQDLEKPTPYRTDKRLMILTMARLGHPPHDWNAISDRNKLWITSDTVHLNARSGEILMELILVVSQVNSVG